jgi:hypothetical protein
LLLAGLLHHLPTLLPAILSLSTSAELRTTLHLWPGNLSLRLSDLDLRLLLPGLTTAIATALLALNLRAFASPLGTSPVLAPVSSPTALTEQIGASAYNCHQSNSRRR